MKDVMKFETVQDAVKWLNEKDVNRVNFVEIASNYELVVEGMNCLQYTFDDGARCLAFFKIENGKAVDFETIEINLHAILDDYEEIESWMDAADFETMLEKFNYYLEGRPLMKGEDVLRVFENWVDTKEYVFGLNELVRLYEYNILIKEVDDIAKNVTSAVGARYKLRVKNKIIRNLIF